MAEEESRLAEEVLDEKLARIRTQINSKLDNQKNLALILSAVEENIAEQNNSKTPVAYFVSFLALLEQTVVDDEVAESSVAAAAAYFLDLVLPATPKLLLKLKFPEILTKLAPLLNNTLAEAALTRSSVGALETLLLAQDHLQWTAKGNVSPQRALVGMLELSFDPRPKVRKRAQEAVRTVLLHVPASPSPMHPAAGLSAELSLKRLVELIQTAQKQAKKAQNKDAGSAVIHALQLVSAITSANAWPADKVDALCDVLLDVSRTSDQYLVSAAFAAFDGLFASMSHEIDIERFARVLRIILDLKPPVDDTHLAAAWLAVVANGFQSFARLSPESAVAQTLPVFSLAAEFLLSETRDIFVSASQCMIAIISECVPERFLLQPGPSGVSPELFEEVDDMISSVAEAVEKDLLSLKYQHATKEVLEVATTCVTKFRLRSDPYFLPVLEIVGQWRSNEEANFPHNKEAEDLIAACISTMGAEAVLQTLPLNLTGAESGPGRAWMLPLLRDNVRFARLGYFQTELLPLVAFFADKIAASGQDSMHAKIFATIVDQIWALLPHFADLPRDLQSAFTDEFATQLAELLYSDVERRTVICHALRLMVESNAAYGDGALADDVLMAEQLSVQQAQENLLFLAAKAPNMLSVLFNVFSLTVPEARAYVLETIDAYLGIILPADLEATFDKVCGILKKAMEEDTPQDTPLLSVTMMDLVVAMAKYVPPSSHGALFQIFATTVHMKAALMQKRAYRVVTKMAEAPAGQAALAQHLGDVASVFVATTNGTNTSARAARLAAMAVVVELLPAHELHFIPSVLQEVIMSTKDVNERSREAAYGLLIQMGRKMAQCDGTLIENSKVPGFGADAEPTPASLTQFFTMVSAGLAAQTPHMISAAITAVSCITYEFRLEVPQEVLTQLAATVELFLTHNGREIAKAAIGFVKVEVLSLPEEYVRENLADLLGKLMRWSHEHKGHFKSKVKHIVERLVRKFGAEAVEAAMPADDLKLVANIKKTRARAKRREAEADAAGANDPEKPQRFMSAYEQAVYGSDSEESDAEVDKPRGRPGDKYILDTGDEPLDLLDRQTLAHISSSRPKAAKPKKALRVETKNGKLVFGDKDADVLGSGLGIDAYVDALKQAPVRGQRNRLKFKKNNDADDWSDSDHELEAPAPKARASGRVSKPRPKQRLKAKKKL